MLCSGCFVSLLDSQKILVASTLMLMAGAVPREFDGLLRERAVMERPFGVAYESIKLPVRTITSTLRGY
jgi:hypothetical protein